MRVANDLGNQGPVVILPHKIDQGYQVLLNELVC